MYIASNVKYLRTKNGLTQTELAKALEKTSAAISDYEKGKATPPLDVAFRIAHFFKIKIDDLVGKDLPKEDILAREGITSYSEAHFQAKYEGLLKELQILQRLTKLQDQRLAELEREIREHAPELARRLRIEA